MSAPALSPEQERVAAYIAEHGGVIRRSSGGFWTTDDTVRNRRGPVWFTTVRTVRAMERKGALVRVGSFAEEWRDDRRLVPEGYRAAFAEAEASK